MRVRPLAAALLLASLALSGCQAVEGERQDQERPVPETPVPEESQAEVVAPDGAPDLVVADSSIGGAKEGDPLWQGLEKAAAEGEEIYLRATVHSFQGPLGEGEQLTVTSDFPDSVSVTVDADRIDSFNDVFHRITGTFTVEEIGASSYTLTTVSEEEIPELMPETPGDEERCTQEQAQDRVAQAAYALLDSPDDREDLRLAWAGSPGVWWAIQATAESLGDSREDVASDALTEACAPYLG